MIQKLTSTSLTSFGPLHSNLPTPWDLNVADNVQAPIDFFLHGRDGSEVLGIAEPAPLPLC